MDKLRLLVATSRPVSWINTAYPFAAGYLVVGGAVDAVFVVGTLFFLIPYNLLMYGVNDVYDYVSDIRNPRKGGIEGAVTPQRYHQLILWSAYLSCVPFVLALAVLGWGWPFLVLLVLLFFVVAYSIAGLRFKERPFLDSATSSIHFVGPLVYALALLGFPGQAWPFVAAFFAWGVASQSFGAVQDIVPDREGGIGSIATVLGARWTVRFSAACYLLAAVVVAAQGGPAIVVAAAGLVYVANVAPFLNLDDARSGRARAGWKRFIWINYVVGFIITMCLIAAGMS